MIRVTDLALPLGHAPQDLETALCARLGIAPAELVRFRARLAAPPDAGKSVRVRFGEAKAPAVAKTQ